MWKEEKEEAEKMIKEREREERREFSLILRERAHMYHPVLDDFQAALSLSLPPLPLSLLSGTCLAGISRGMNKWFFVGW